MRRLTNHQLYWLIINEAQPSPYIGFTFLFSHGTPAFALSHTDTHNTFIQRIYSTCSLELAFWRGKYETAWIIYFPVQRSCQQGHTFVWSSKYDQTLFLTWWLEVDVVPKSSTHKTHIYIYIYIYIYIWEMIPTLISYNSSTTSW